MDRPYDLYPGAKVKFLKEKRPYKVICTSKRFTICSKPFNLQNTVLYTIIDWEDEVRGPENLVFGMGAETTEECLEMLVRLMDGDTSVSSRHGLKLDLEWIKHDNEVIWPMKSPEYGVNHIFAYKGAWCQPTTIS